jgi:hypothetical protein
MPFRFVKASIPVNEVHMAKRIPKSIFDSKFEYVWQTSRRFLATGMRLTKKRRGRASHFAGGPLLYKCGKCAQCGRKLTLLWNLDLSDSLLPAYMRDGFAPADRLPLCICWQCVAASYRVTSNDRMTCFTFDAGMDPLKEDETPFGDSPAELPLRRIAFERIPSKVDAILSLADIVGLDALDQDARKTIDDYFEKPVTSGWDMPFSQFGGQPLLYQGHWNAKCPNPKCPASRIEHPYGEKVVHYLMKEMALVHFDHEPELAKACFQLLYYICGVCFSIRAEYRCD